MSYIKPLNINSLGYGKSFIHNLHPYNKAILLIINYVIIFSLNIKYLSIYLLFLTVLSLLTVINIRSFLKLILFLTFYSLGFLLLIIIMGLDNKLLTYFIVMLKFYSMILPIMFYSFSTPLKQTNYVLYKICLPLEKIKVNSNLVNLTFTIIITYIPIILYDFDNVLLIKASKGEDIKEVNVIKKVLIIQNTLFTVLVNSFQRANFLTDSVLIRNFHKNKKRSNYISYNYKLKDKVVTVLLLVLFLILLITT